jgi:hypothetical protein
MRTGLLGIAGLVAGLAAGGIAWAEGVKGGVEGGAAKLPEAAAKRILSDPQGFVEDAAGLILAYGGDRGLDAGGVARLVAAETARQRARAVARLLPADLDGDARIARPELAALLAQEKAAARGRLELAFREADTDADAVLTLAELYAASTARAASAAESAGQAARQVLACDTDGDGAATLDEVLETVRGLRDQPA